MEDFLIIAILVVVLGGAIAYIIKAKKSGVKCIGCSAGGSCGRYKKQEGCCCGCGSNSVEKESSESCSCNCQADK